MLPEMVVTTMQNENERQSGLEFLSFEMLSQAVAGNAAAFRQTTRLLPAGGPESKVFPPTHSGGVYAWEQRRIAADNIVTTVLLDSVQSQANRMEQALLEAYHAEILKFPLLQADFSYQFPDIGVITTLDAPHRIADAIFRDSLLEGKKFRESDVGKAFTTSNIRNATGLFQYCPHALIFGIWDSTGSEGGMGNKFQRAVVSEIVGMRAEKGVHTSSRIDPISITKAAEVYKTPDGNWTMDPENASKNKKGEPEKARPSEFLHGNIPPTIDLDERNEPLRGGVTIDYALQTTVLSLPALRRLRFPVNGKDTPDGNNAARTLLAAMALAGVVYMKAQGYDLRSRCLLVPDGVAPIELIANDGRIKKFELDTTAVTKIYEESVNRAKEVGLPWQDEIIKLEPEKRLVSLVQKSREARSVAEE
jgi:CRISPR-associated protein Csb1